VSVQRIAFWILIAALALTGWGCIAGWLLWGHEMQIRERLDRAK
jgi:hypothetical protein